MSRTLRINTIDETYDKTQRYQKSIRSWGDSKKMPPYAPKGSYKFVVDAGRGTGVSKTGKLVCRNANRSLKKAERQKAKQEIKSYLES